MNEDDAKQLAEVASKDLVRLGESIYRAAGRLYDDESHAEGELPITDGGVKIVSERGPGICLDHGFGAFKASYSLAQHALIQRIRPHIKGNTRRFEITFHRDDSPEEFGYHKWSVFGASAESEARLASAGGDVTAEDAARVLRV